MNRNYTLKPDFSESAQRFTDFWQQRNGKRPLLYPRSHGSQRPEAPAFAHLSRKEKEASPDWHWDYLQRQLTAGEFLWEAMPNAQVMLGRDIVAAACLAGFDFTIDEVSECITFAAVPDLLQRPIPKFQPELPFVCQTMAIYQKVCAKTGSLAFVNPPTTADALTTVMMLLGEDVFCRACLRQPNQVLDIALQLNTLFYDFYDYVYAYLVKQGYGQSGSWFPVFVEGKFDSLRSDVSVLLSPASFAELSLPLLEAASKRVDYNLFNLDCAGLLRFLPQLKQCGFIQGIYWNLPPWQIHWPSHLPILQELRQAGLLLAIPCASPAEAKMLYNALGSRGLLLELSPNWSKDQIQKAEQLFI